MIEYGNTKLPTRHQFEICRFCLEAVTKQGAPVEILVGCPRHVTGLHFTTGIVAIRFDLFNDRHQVFRQVTQTAIQSRTTIEGNCANIANETGFWKWYITLSQNVCCKCQRALKFSTTVKFPPEQTAKPYPRPARTNINRELEEYLANQVETAEHYRRLVTQALERVIGLPPSKLDLLERWIEAHDSYLIARLMGVRETIVRNRLAAAVIKAKEQD